MSTTEEATTATRAWLSLAALLLALATSAAVQWELLPPAWLPQLPALWGLAALLGALAWRLSTPVVAKAGLEAEHRGQAPGWKVFIAPATIAALLCLAAGLGLLAHDLLSQAGTVLWAIGIAGVPLALAWGEARAQPTNAGPSTIRQVWLGRVALCGILALALVLRLYALEDLPAKYIDDEGAVSDWGLNYLHGTPLFGQHLVTPLTLFRNGTTAYPLLGSYVHALVMQVAGESIFGSRLTAALAGVLCVAVLYALLADHVQRWAALAAAFLLAVCHTHLYWSRSGIPQSMTTTAVAAFFWLTLRGLRSGSYATFAFAGLLLGLAQYFYEGARFFVPVLGLFFLARALLEKGFIRARGLHVLVMAATAALVFAPIAFWYYANPNELLARSQGVLIFAHPEYIESRYPGLDTTGVVLAQLQRGLEGLAYRGDGSNFFSLRGPILDPVARVLALTGVLAVVALRARLRFLVSLWVWIPIAIVCIPTIDPPSMTRLIQVVPALFVVAGLVLDRLGLVTARAAGRPGLGLLGAATLAALAYAAQWNLSEFFLRYPREHVADAQTLGGKLVRSYGPDYQVRVLGGFSFYAPSVRFLARGIAGEDLPPTTIPLPGRGWRDGLILIEAERSDQIARLRDTYPSAVEGEHRNSRGDLLLHSFRVPAAAMNAAAGAGAPWRVPDARFGRLGGRLGEFSSPRALAVDRRGFVYVADAGNRRVEVFAPDGRAVSTFAGPGTQAPIGMPFSLALLEDESVLVLGREPYALRRYRPDGTWIADVAVKEKLVAPVAIAPAPGGFYLADAATAHVLRFDLDGEVVARSGGRGPGPGEFDNPIALAAEAGGRLYVFDAGNRRLVRLSPDLVYETEWPFDQQVDRMGQMLAVGPPSAARVYAVDTRVGAVQRFTPDGVAEWAVGLRGDFPGNLAWPVAVALDDQGNVYLADENRGQIFRYDLSREATPERKIEATDARDALNGTRRPQMDTDEHR